MTSRNRSLVFWRKYTALAKELPAYWKLLGTEQALFFAEDAYSFYALAGYIEELRKTHPVEYITAEADDPLENGKNFTVNRMPEMGLTFLGRTAAPVLALTMPDLGVEKLVRPSPKTRCFYIFHSLISSHRGYLETAYDHYDDFFCCHSHHVRELTARFASLGKKRPNLHEVGYYKLEAIQKAHQTFQRADSSQPSVLIAPSWHPGNLLEGMGCEIVDSLLRSGLKVIVRPHPAFLQPIYATGRDVLGALKKFENEPHFEWDLNFSSQASFHSADLMVSDWSGAALEYALGTERPVLFVDTPYKTRNQNWAACGITPFEEELRPQLGRIITADEARHIGTAALQFLEQKGYHREKLVALRNAEIFNFGSCSQVGAGILRDALRRA